MPPIMSFYTEKEYKDILDLFLEIMSTSTSLTFASYILYKNINSGHTNNEYVQAMFLLNTEDIDGFIPVRLNLSDVVRWVSCWLLDGTLALPITIYRVVDSTPYVFHDGVEYIMDEVTGDKLAEYLNNNYRLGALRGK